MLVGCYTLDCYCDGPGPHPYWYEFPQQFTGHTEAQCKRQARRSGWRLGKERQLCPLCSGAVTESWAKTTHYSSPAPTS